MRKLSVTCSALILCLLLASAASAAQTQTVGGRWLAEGSGFAEKGILRVSLTADGYVNINSTNENGVETITGYDVYSVLHATKLEFNAWSYSGSQRLATPLSIPDYNPTLSNPLTLPPFTMDGLEYAVTLTSVTSGTVKIRGDVNIDGFGKCEVNADCALWKEGTAKPDIPSKDSGCDAGAGGAAAGLLLLAACLRRRG